MKRYPRELGRTALVAAALAGGIAGIVPASAVAAPSLADYQLRPAKNQAELLDRVKKLDAELPKLGVQEILDQANRSSTPSSTRETCNRNATAGRHLVTLSYCFDDSDSSQIGAKVEWMPQGVTTVADAQQDQQWGSKQAILISWYDKSPEDGGASGGDADKVKGVRITFLDWDTGKYQHVLLVYPFINDSGNATYMSLRTTQVGTSDSLHAGGLAWYGNYLYVPDTARGFRVFDMRYIFDLESASHGDTADKAQIGRQSGVFYGHGYRYVMPQVGAWISVEERDPSLKCTANAGSPTFSFAGIDRTGADHLTTGEFCDQDKADGDLDKTGRVARLPLNGDTGEPLLSGGLWKADAVYRLPIGNIQGAVSYDGKWYLSRSHGASNGVLYVTKPIGTATGTLQIDTAHHAGVGPEDLSHWPKPDGSPGGLWTVTEYPGKRLLYVCDIGTLNDTDRLDEICGLDPSPPN